MPVKMSSARALVIILLIAGILAPRAAAQQPANSPIKLLGTVRTISGSTVVVAADSGTESTVQIDGSTRIVRVEPGQKDLKGATLLQVNQLQPGDRVRVRGTPAQDGKAVLASSILVMKQSDLAAKQERDREEWQRHGTGGLVTAVDPAGGLITISATTFAGKKTTIIRVSKDTIIRRYAADSVRFDDAKPATLDQIKVGDQLRARGTRNPDGTEVVSDEVVVGTFRNIAGTILAIDPAANTINVMDAITKKPVLVKVSGDSQLRKMPPEMAERIALRLKGAMPVNAGGGQEPTPANAAAGAPPLGAPGGQSGFPHRNGGPPDFQQMLFRLPQLSVSDLQKGDAVMIVSTEGTSSGEVTAITLLSGVEPILAASPKGGEGMVLSPWTLGGGGGGEDSN